MKKFKFYIIPALIITFGLLIGFKTINCGNINFSGLKGNGKVVSEERKVADFNCIEASGAFNIFLNEGNETFIKVEADENIIKHIKTEVVNSTLKLYTDNSITDAKKLNININYKKLIAVESDGVCMIIGNSEIKTAKFSSNVSGASCIKLKLPVQELNTVSSGAGSIDISGNTDIQYIELSGASSFNALNFITNITTSDLSGTGSAEINAIKEIKGELSGIGSVSYKGEPFINNLTISGLGIIKKIK